MPGGTFLLEFNFVEVQGPRCKCVFLYCFYLAKILKNHNKSLKNRKIENEDFLESLRVDLCSGVII